MIDEQGSAMSPPEPSDGDLERAIASVPGVEAATVERLQDSGRSRLRIRLSSAEDAQMVSWAVAATLRERFGIDLDPQDIRSRIESSGDDGVEAGGVTQLTVDALLEEPDADRDRGSAVVDHPPASADRTSRARRTRAAPKGAAGDPTSTPAGLAPRAAIQNLDTRIDVTDVVVTATLSHGSREVTAEATSVPTHQGVLRAVAEATVRALAGLTDGGLVAGVDRVSVSVAGDPPIATVVVSVVGDRGEDTLLGASLVRGDPQLAVMRATLDALNRRVERLLADRTDGLVALTVA
jgi:hypothetical protein